MRLGRYLEIVTDMVGTVTVIVDAGRLKAAFHWLLSERRRQWGFAEEWYDGPFWSFGLGRVLLVVVTIGGKGESGESKTAG